MDSVSDTSRVSVIMVTYNSDHVLGEALSCLPDDTEVIVVDNMSTDRSVETVRAIRPSARIVENPSNAGFAEAVNKGAKSASREFILLLNPDARIDGSAIATLVHDLDVDSSVGIGAPLMADPHGAFKVLGAGHAPTIRNMTFHGFGISRIAPRSQRLEGHHLYRDSNLDRIRYIDWVSGGCLLVRASLWATLNGLTTRWFMYAEDIEFCLRARDLGWRVILDPSALATHDFGGSSKGIQGNVNTIWIVNLYELYCLEIAKNSFQKQMWKILVCAGFLGRAFVYRVFMAGNPSRREQYGRQVARYSAFALALRKANF